MRWFNDARVHKKRNVLDHLPNGMREQVSASLSQAYHSRDFERARRLMMGLARKLEADYPRAAASLREGLDETLTVMGMGLPGVFGAYSLEHERHREPARHGPGGGGVSPPGQALVGGGPDESRKRECRVRGYQGMAHLSAALERNDERIDGNLKAEEAA